MAIRLDTKRSSFFKELSLEEQNNFFNLKTSKFLHNIDTFYYSIFIQEDANLEENVNINIMLEELKELKQNLLTENADALDFLEGTELMFGRHADYTYRLSSRDQFDIFITSHIRNSNTPRILVQIRSYYLWTQGIDNSIQNSYLKVVKILEHFNLKISRTQENRIDYAFHTNSIQNPIKFFTIDKLNTHCFGNLKAYKIMGELRKEEDNYTINYVSLGTHNSNNLFFRIYNKTKEVVEMGYKSFFFNIWHSNGLINFYDKFCLEYAYKKQNYDLVYQGALEFYLLYGKDKNIKNNIVNMLNSNNYTLTDIKEYALTFMPKITIILNIEYETKRKYYYYYKDVIDLLPVPEKTDIKLQRLYKIVFNSKIFIDMLTEKVVYFSLDKNNKDIYLDFWKRLKSLKINSLSTSKIKADYNSSVDLDKLKTKAINSIISYSSYKNSTDTDFVSDVFDLLNNLNDNDFKNNKYKNISAIDTDTGEIFRIYDHIKEDYLDKKNKKYKQIKNRLK